jgi:hypothetical protein
LVYWLSILIVEVLTSRFDTISCRSLQRFTNITTSHKPVKLNAKEVSGELELPLDKGFRV